MARIPTSNFRTRLSTDVARTPTRSIGSAGIVARAQSNVGQAAAQLAGVIAEKREISQAESFLSEEGTNLDIEIQDLEANLRQKYSGKNAKGFTEDFRAQSEKLLNEKLKNSPNSKASAALEKRGRSFLGQKLRSANSYENIELAKAARTGIMDSATKLGYAQFQVGDEVLGKQRHDDFVKNVQAKVGLDINQEAASLLIADGKLKIANGTIEAKLRNGQFGDAKKLVEENYLGAFDQESQSKMLKKIELQQRQTYDRQISDFNKLEKLAEDRRKKRVGEIQQTLLNQALNGVDIGPAVREYIRAGELNLKEYRTIQRDVMNPLQKERDNEKTFQMTKRFFDGEDLDVLEEEISNEAFSGNMSPENATRLLKTLNSKKAAMEKPLARQNMKNGDNLIKGVFPVKNALNMEIPGRKEALTEIMIERDDLVANGADPLTASRAVIKKFKKFDNMDIIPDISSELQRTPNINDKAIRRAIRDKLIKGKISKEEAARQLELHEDRKIGERFKDVMGVAELNEQLGNM